MLLGLSAMTLKILASVRGSQYCDGDGQIRPDHVCEDRARRCVADDDR
jgi:hypothetical protein